MKYKAVNPILPSNEYVTQVEPKIFGDRVYLYGAHDEFDAPILCMGDYVCYSASVSDLSDWRFEGTIYKKEDDPKSFRGFRLLFAPDVVQGRDGNFYLYYCLDVSGILGVAKSDNPAGPFTFLDHVHYDDGTLLSRKKDDYLAFNPSVLVDDEIYLYYGFSKPVPKLFCGGKNLKTEGGVVATLKEDMVTIKTGAKLLFPCDITGKEEYASFANHEFYEPCSVQKIHDTYYFVYTSKHQHELCYAYSKYPDKGYVYGGNLVDLGDLFFTDKHSKLVSISEYEKRGDNYLGNLHGGILHVDNGHTYVFYHRHTNRHLYSRQTCADRLEHKVHPDGSLGFIQTELTSCGLNGGPLPGIGHYPAYIACNLWSKDGVTRYDGKHRKRRLAGHPYFTQERHFGSERAYIEGMRDGAVAGFKYFEFSHAERINFYLRGSAYGKIIVALDPHFGRVIGSADVFLSIDMQQKAFTCDFDEEYRGELSRDHREQLTYHHRGQHTENYSGYELYFKYQGSGYIDFYSFSLE